MVAIRKERELERQAHKLAKEKYKDIIGDEMSRFKLRKLKKQILKNLEGIQEKEESQSTFNI